ncbi:MAG TPA: hypothetical protein VG870_00250 [Chitinophagaceae bacterium]|nr:hypothetical protein [Chitinophagaceae bacterium]
MSKYERMPVLESWFRLNFFPNFFNRFITQTNPPRKKGSSILALLKSKTITRSVQLVIWETTEMSLAKLSPKSSWVLFGISTIHGMSKFNLQHGRSLAAVKKTVQILGVRNNFADNFWEGGRFFRA